MNHLTTIIRLDGRRVPARYVHHCRTLTDGRRNEDVALYLLADGSQVECLSPSGDCRVTPVEVNASSDRYPGHAPGA